MDLMRRWLAGWRLCRGLPPVIEYDDAYAAVLALPGRERELFARDDDPAVVDRLAKHLPPDHWLTITTHHGDDIASQLAAAGVRPFDEHKTLMSIDLTAHPQRTAADESDGPLEYVRVYVDGIVAAHGMMAIVGTDAIMHDIQTEAAYRRRGLGNVVMGALAARALDRGARTGILMATTDGFHLYRKLGWQAEATMVTGSGCPRPVSGDLGPVLTGR
ncbi:GNAT family N-acetyltransferase [Kribbella solani]|uniref:GNAT superfamily N-acetyltransferase n=1 Tax=Kribbella solani TaxID=236067 RepID=A0A841DRJ9_9ACTN|nr:GNAT family N-acetyltransferase [Kribbella solani]MBB5981212.1 GNAT superfamily N-acetyltransferase [Kribbella solani]